MAKASGATIPAERVSIRNSQVATDVARVSARRTLLYVLLALAVVPYFLDLGGSSIWDANEAFYVETPREMVERGDYVSPTFNYEPRFNKPVLSYWIVAAFYNLFGVSVAVQRVPIAFGAMVLIAAAFFLAAAANSSTEPEPRAPSSRRRAPSRLLASEAAVWAALGLAITPRLLMFSRRIFIDIYVSMFMALTLLFFALAERYPARRRVFLVLMYGAVGLGVLTKGPVAAALPALVFALYLLVFRELRRVTAMMLPAGMLIVLAIVLPWYGAVYARHGWDYITAFFVGENVARFTAGVGVESSRGPLFYLPVVFSDSFPWSIFLFASAATWLALRREGMAAREAGFRIRTLIWLWIVAIVLFFSLSAAKQDLYIFPIVPAVAALGGLAAARGGNPARYTAAAIGAMIGICAAGVLVLFNADSTAYSLEGAAAMGWLGVAGGAAVIVLAFLNRPHAALLAVAAAFTALNWVFVVKALPSFERYKPVPAFARTLQPRLEPDDVVATYDEALPSLVYYLGRHIEQLFLEEQLIGVFGSGRTVYAVLSTDNYARLAGAIGVPTCIIDRRPTFDVKLKTVLARGPLPELVVITNRCR